MSSDIVIRVENLSKRYTIKHAANRHRSSGDGLRHALQDAVSAPFRSLRRRFQSRNAAPRNAPTSNFLPSISSSEDFWALKDVCFEVKRGEVLGIIGRNGAGKSTLLKILSRITEPSLGRVGLKGRVASLLEVGTGFHPELTGRENIFLNGAILGMSRAEVRGKFDEIVAFAEVERFLNTPVKRYSSGMYVRLAFAVAAHLEPEILIIDEVLAVGDFSFQQKCLGKMKDVSKIDGRAVLFVSHNISAVTSLCTRCLYVANGRVKAVGDVDQMVTLYHQAIHANNIPKSENIRLTDNVMLQSLAVETNPVEAGRELVITLQFTLTALTHFKELALIICSASGARVAVVDLQRGRLVEMIEGLNKMTVSIANCLLVEGDYQIGLFIDFPGYQADITEITSFKVTESSDNPHKSRYAARNRGFCSFAYRVNQVSCHS